MLQAKILLRLQHQEKIKGFVNSTFFVEMNPNSNNNIAAPGAAGSSRRSMISFLNFVRHPIEEFRRQRRQQEDMA